MLQYFIALILSLCQAFATVGTQTRIFSRQAWLQNMIWGFVVWQVFQTHNLWLLFLLPFSKLLINAAVYFGARFDSDYLTTKYLYNDYFHSFVPECPGCEYFTEGLRDDSCLPVEQLEEPGLVMKQFQKNKFEWIADQLEIKPGMRLLEIGFGNLDLMTFLRDKGAQCEGANISKTQLQHARDHGFTVYEMSYTEMHKQTDLFGRYDIVITNGSLEYLRRYRESTVCYGTFADAVSQLLKPGGKWYASTLHVNNRFSSWNNLYNRFMGYTLTFANEGGYPYNEDGLTKYGQAAGMDLLLQEDHTMDYQYYSKLFGRCYDIGMKKASVFAMMKMYWNSFLQFWSNPNYFETVHCYYPRIMRDRWYLGSWLWQFLPQKNNETPISLYWIIFQRPEDEIVDSEITEVTGATGEKLVSKVRRRHLMGLLKEKLMSTK